VVWSTRLKGGLRGMRVDWGLFFRRLVMLIFGSWLLFQTGKALLQAREAGRRAAREELRALYLEAERLKLLEELRRLRTLEGRAERAREAGYIDPRRGERLVRFVEVPPPAGVREGWRRRGR